MSFEQDYPGLQQAQRKRPLLRVLIVFGVALLYALFCRLIFGWKELYEFFPIVSISFLTLVPMAFGGLTTFLGYRFGGPSAYWIYVAPMLVALLGFIGSFLVHLEALLCLVVAAPIMLPMAMIGGRIMAWLLYHRSTRLYVSVIVLLPFAVAPIEARWKAPPELVSIEDSIHILASPSDIWAEIASVRTIAREEVPFRWIYLLDFPRPIAATLDREGVGGQRRATFERDVSFFETVTDWEPERTIAFTIKADPEFIPHTAFDQHIIVGGRFYDVLDGRYVIRREGDGCRLLLTSTHRLSTRFNAYAGWWSRLVMNQIQSSILTVIKNRAELRAAQGARG
ncbi:hypothetical protein LBMAG57_30100 [Verrucomicrobiota bacterium]|nr:hypothetical protein LBMAG57_30100 [Verrucomicrobiota bacterium]